MKVATAFSDEKEQEEQQVSDNVLVIEISGPDLFSMEIVDTPGLSSSECIAVSVGYNGSLRLQARRLMTHKNSQELSS